MLSFFRTSYHWSRSSAASMAEGGVPQIFTKPSPDAAGMGCALRYASIGEASLSGVCPPNWTMMPSGRSVSRTFSTSSTVRGSK